MTASWVLLVQYPRFAALYRENFLFHEKCFSHLEQIGKYDATLLMETFHQPLLVNSLKTKIFDITCTAWEVSVFGVILVRVFSHSDWTRRDTQYLSVLSPNAGKHGPEKLQVRTLFTQCKLYQRFYFLNYWLKMFDGRSPLTFNISVARIYRILICIGMDLFISKGFSKGDILSLYSIRNHLSREWSTFLFIVRLWNIQINGQYLNCGMKKEFIKMCLFSKFR